MRNQRLLLMTGCAALALSILVYLTDRSASPVLLLPRVAALADWRLFGAPGYWLPSFVHPLALSLFTAAALNPGAVARRGACVAWCAVNIAFEAGQHPAFKWQWAEALHTRVGDWAVTRPVLEYFARGTFAWNDIFAAISGSLVAAIMLHFVDRHQEGH